MRSLVAAAGGPAAASALRFERVAAKDWVGESLAGLKPVAAGRFVVHGAHDRTGIPANRIGIEIEAALAFGTGHHGTTRGCLLALDGCANRARRQAPRRAFSISAPAAACSPLRPPRALRQRVLATDIDAERRPRRARQCPAQPGRRLGRGRESGRRRRAGAFARARRSISIFANILLGPLQRLAAPLTKLVAPGGRVVLSGLLTSQANAALSAYRALALERRIELDGWTTLV